MLTISLLYCLVSLVVTASKDRNIFFSKSITKLEIKTDYFRNAIYTNRKITANRLKNYGYISRSKNSDENTEFGQKVAQKGHSCVDKLDAKLFSNLPKLKIIEITEICTKKIEPGIFPWSLKSLNYVGTPHWTLINNSTAGLDIPYNAFDNLRFLEKLQIQDANLQMINKRWFQNLRMLKKIDFTYNNLKIINNDHFKHLFNLRSLTLDYNVISVIEPLAFKPISNTLEVLSIAHNELDSGTIDSGLFDYNNNLKELILDENWIYDFPKASTTKNLTNLEVLSLSENLIKYLPKDIFKNLNNLTVLNLAKNQLTKIWSSAFEHLTKLEVVNLNDNEIDYCDARALKSNKQLKSLSIYGNKMTERQISLLQRILSNRKVKFYF